MARIRIPNRNHPVYMYRDRKNDTRRKLQALSNDDLHNLCVKNNIGIIPKERHRKIALLIDISMDKWKETFKQTNGFDWEDSKDPLLFQKRLKELEESRKTEAQKHKENSEAANEAEKKSLLKAGAKL